MAGSRRVVVGVGTSPAAIRALRLAVTEARARGSALCAVRARGIYGEPGPGPDGAVLTTEIGDDSRLVVERAFAAACGGRPTDVEVTIVTPLGDTGPVLARTANRPDDILVVGNARHGLFHRIANGAVARYLARHATCPVLLVPPPDLIRDLGPWHRLLHRTPHHVPDWLTTDA